MMNSIIDLHCHSTISDGLLTPTELVNYAKEFDISLVKGNGKKKVKKELYDDINLSKF